jgi:hypothetical protein
MEIGGLQGLAVRNTHQGEIDDMKYFSALNKQNEAINMAKAKMYADDTEFQNGSNNYDAQKIREEGNAALNELAALKKAHPHDFWTSPTVQVEAKQIKNKLKSSPAVLRSIAYKDAQDKYNTIFEDYLKNPSKYNDKDIQGIRTQLSNYDKFGHAEGVDGFQRDGGARPITFNPPKVQKDLEELFKVAKEINPDEITPIHNGRDGAYRKSVSDKSLMNLATTMYNAEPDQYRRFQEAGKDPIQEIANGLKLRARTEEFGGYEKDNFYAHADYMNRLKAATQTAPEETVYKKVIVDSDNIPMDAEDFSAAFGSTPTVQYKAPDGSTVTEDGNVFYANNLRDKNYQAKKDAKGNRVKVPYQKDGLKVADGFFFKPVDDPKYADVLYDDKLWGTEMKVKPEFADTYEIFTNPKGEKLLKIRASTTVNANSPEHARKYESRIKSTADQRNLVGSGSMMQQEIFQDEAGTLWTQDENGKYVKVNK